MKIQKFEWAGLAYMLLLAANAFAPDYCGATLKYGFVQLVLLVALCGVRMKLTWIKALVLGFLAIALISTLNSFFSYGDRTNFRSLCILLGSFFLLSDVVFPAHVLERIKSFYIVCVIVCGLIISVRIPTITKNSFLFIWGERDFNYLLSFMLPGCYLALRRLVFENQGKRPVNILAVVATLASTLLFQRRAAFLTLLLVGIVMFGEYLLDRRLSRTKVLSILALPAIVVLFAIWFVSSPVFSRLNSRDSYENNVRLAIWTEALRAFDEHPIMGSGTGVASYYSELETGYQSHNNYIDILGDYGIVGSATFLALLLIIVFGVAKQKLHMLAYAISALFPMGFINGFQTLAFWVPMLLLVHERNALNFFPGNRKGLQFSTSTRGMDSHVEA